MSNGSTRVWLVMAFVLFMLPAAFGAMMRLLLDLMPSRRYRTGHLFLLIVAVVVSRAESIVIVVGLRPTHSLFVGVPTTFFFNMIMLDLTILDATVDQARTGSSELAWLVLNSQQQAPFSALCPCREAGARRLRFRTWDDFTTSTRDHLAHGRT